MASNYIQPGKRLTFIAPSGGVISGQALLMGTLFVIAQGTAAQGLEFEGMLVGVHTLPKVSAQAWTIGAKVYWDDTAKNVTTTVGSNSLIGAAAAVAANPSATGAVRLNGVTI